MLLTRKANGSVDEKSRLARGLNGVLGKTIDRRTFLKRSGITAGAGVAATQIPFSMLGEAQAADAPAGKTEVKRTTLVADLVRDRRRGAGWRLDPPGAGVRLADQPRRALRQGRLDPRARHHP